MVQQMAAIPLIYCRFRRHLLFIKAVEKTKVAAEVGSRSQLNRQVNGEVNGLRNGRAGGGVQGKGY